MKYIGRMALAILSLLTALSFWFLEDAWSPFFFVFSMIHVIVSWFIGEFYDKYIFLSYHDPLTGVYNRRYVDKVLNKKFLRSTKLSEKIGILAIDINQFKAINDTFGHNNGDFVLKEVSSLVQKCISKEDIVVRWGGDEFLVLFFNRDKLYAEHLIKQINERVLYSLKSCEEKDKVFPTLSMGFSMYPEDGEIFSDLISVADKRMFQDKRIKK